MAKEIQVSRPDSVEKQLQDFSVPELFEEAAKLNSELATFGVTTPVSLIFYAASAYGDRYEDRRYPGGGVKTTPLNCFMALLHNQKGLKQLPQAELEKLAGVIGKLSITIEVLYEKQGSFSWPEALQKHPQVRVVEPQDN